MTDAGVQPGDNVKSNKKNTVQNSVFLWQNDFSREDAVLRAESMFAKLDVNGDGDLTEVNHTIETWPILGELVN